MENRSVLIKKLCPKCLGCTLEFYENESSVVCYSCDETLSVTELLASNATLPIQSGVSTENDDQFAVLSNVDSSESALIYLENKFDNYDWARYKESNVILIDEIESMVRSNKIVRGASSASWLLDFMSVATPILKKFEGISEIAQKMADIYTGDDNADLLFYFDLYKNITAELSSRKNEIIKRLESDIELADKLGLDAEKLASIKSDLEKIKARFEGIKEVSEVEDISEVLDAKEKLRLVKLHEFSEKGIDAAEIYRTACNIYNNEQSDNNEALRLFEYIRGYADSVKYINKINYYYDYNGKFYNFYGRNYIFKTKVNTPTFDPKSKEKKTEEVKEEDLYTGRTAQLYEIVDGEPAKEPILKNITKIISFYGNKLFYVKLGKAICSFDLLSLNETELCAGEPGEIKFFADDKTGSIYTNYNSSSFYIRKKLPIEMTEKPGCIQSLLGKKSTVIERKNNYSVLEINFVENSCKEAIDAVIDITEQRGNYIFYTVAEETKIAENTEETEDIKDKDENKDAKTILMTLDTKTGVKKAVLSENCEINGIMGSKVVYSLYSPNKYNVDLRVYDINDDTDVLIEKNVYYFYRIIKDRVYYCVGNSTYRPLFSNNFEGTDRVEIMPNIENIVSIHAGWMYVVKGSSRNALLIKVSTDGKQRVLICSQFKRIIKITDTLVYYIDSSDCMRVVRTDGKKNQLITDSIDVNNVIVDRDAIYYLRQERVFETSKNNMSSSLYVMDINGHNVRKVLFNVRSMKNYDENTLYIERGEKICYKIFYPAKKKKNEKEEIKTFSYTRFYKFDKRSGALDTILTIDFPHPDKYQSKGCFKSYDMESVFTEIPFKPEYEQKGAKIGEVLNQQIAEKNANDAKAKK